MAMVERYKAHWWNRDNNTLNQCPFQLTSQYFRSSGRILCHNRFHSIYMYRSCAKINELFVEEINHITNFQKNQTTKKEGQSSLQKWKSMTNTCTRSNCRAIVILVSSLPWRVSQSNMKMLSDTFNFTLRSCTIRTSTVRRQLELFITSIQVYFSYMKFQVYQLNKKCVIFIYLIDFNICGGAKLADMQNTR